MSGQQLVDSLKSLQFPNAESLEPQALDWMFENEAVSPMLEWFCHNISPANILQKKETDEYQKLSQTSEVILKGRHLDEALSNLNFVEDESVTEESLKEEIDQLNANLQHYKKQKSQLGKRRNLLSNHQASLTHRVSKMNTVDTKVKQDYKAALAHTHTVNAQMNESLENLTKSVTELSHLYRIPGTEKNDNSSIVGQSCLPGQTGPPVMFLSQVPIQQYYSAEEAFTTQLTAYTKKQFFQGIAEMASCGEDSRFEILEVSDPDSLLVRGESADVNIKDCKELARLQSLYIKSETDRVKSLLEMKKLKSQKQSAQGILESLKTGTFSTDHGKNKERLQKLHSSIHAVRGDFHELGENEVPKLIQECKDAKVLRVLTGDYNLKLARQDYFTTNQDKVINELVKQRSRNEFVTMALEVELRRHRELHHVLTSLHTQLHKQHVQYQARMSVMSDNSLTPARHKRETIDSRDKSAARLYNCLDDGKEVSEKQLFLTYASLVHNAESLQHRHNSLLQTLESTSNTGLDNVNILEHKVWACEELVYAGSSTTSGQPLLTPRPIQENIIQLQNLLKQLEQGIMEVVKDIDNKKKLLKNDTLLARERKIFTYFFTNPSKLHKCLEDLSSRLQAESHMDQSEQR
ncbi:HAUS augmin-like complex subunit 3 [Ruditapes philippinarum]|uniref:HAUS augmin-like complex subunit 3 n=1 Tax=Ruditapes philippinarum TaxID=129788 RepID=UPI00295A723F|nr:HAUS augmin-like complex subunit 3 [Ruditapes philippinarum]XP_060551459.1 HAUS augmin-like complex subunit 3 [Ruditapes philippinarum]